MADWQDSRVRFIDRVVKNYDHELYAARTSDGIIRILRNGKRFMPFWFSEDVLLQVLVDSPQFVCALTHNWKTSGRPVDWGSERIVQRLKESDQAAVDVISKIDEQNKKVDESKRRDFMNKTEDNLREAYSKIKESWGDIRTANMSMDDRKRKQKYEK